MIISTNWLADYVSVPAEVDTLVERLLLSGLNHESTRTVGADTAIEIEVTSNRPDCLGHIGVAREASVLFDRPLCIPDPRLVEATAAAVGQIAVEIRAALICPFYSARVIRGVRVGPSPPWLVERLATVGVASINNVVDITNYVMLECGQPLHAFDLAKIRGGRIVVRQAEPGESFNAINHKTYSLTEGMCVIADAEGAIALAGVMGGAGTEVSADTTDILLESAQFSPLPIRCAARGLVLASASSYRFERGPDPAAVDWASRRAAAMISEIAGGQSARGLVEAGQLASSPATIDLRPGLSAVRVGVVGEIAAAILTRYGLKGLVVAAELRLDRLEFAVEVERPRHRPSDFPAVERDVNLVVDRALPWGDVAAAIRGSGGSLLEECRLVQVWTDAQRLGESKKSFVVSLRLRSDTGTLSGEDASRTVEAVVAACGTQCGAVLRA